MAITAAGHDQIVTLAELNVMSSGLSIMVGMPALDTIEVLQHVFLDDLCLLRQIARYSYQRCAIGVVGVGKYKYASSVPDQPRCFGKRKRVFGHIAFYQIFVERLLFILDDPFFTR